MGSEQDRIYEFCSSATGLSSRQCCRYRASMPGYVIREFDDYLSLIQYRNEPEPVSLLNSARSRDRRLNWHHNAARFGVCKPRSSLGLLLIFSSLKSVLLVLWSSWARGTRVGARRWATRQRCPRACPHVPQGVCRSEGLVHKSTGRERHFETARHQAAVSACLRDRNSSSRAWFNASAAWTSLTARAALSCSKVTPGSRYCSTSSSDSELIVRCHRVGIAIALSHPALVVALLCREQARTVIVPKNGDSQSRLKALTCPAKRAGCGRSRATSSPPMRSCSPPGRVVGAPGARFGQLPDVQLQDR